jgi:hypothetical protein
MPSRRNVNVATIRFAGAIQHCAHACSYCSIGDKAKTRLPLDRFMPFMERLAQWQQAGPRTVAVIPFFWYSFEYGADAARRMEPIKQAFGLGKLDGITTGGLRLRDREQSTTWLSAWRDFGIKKVHASFAGTGALHDSYNRRDGDFDYLLMLQRVAAELGMQIGQSLFLTRKTVSQIPDLIERLDLIRGQVDHRWIFPPAYMGHGKDLEADRITEDERDALPTVFRRMRLPHFEIWRSEREWLREIEEEEQPGSEAVTCTFHVDARVMDDLERMAAAEIVEMLTRRTVDAYAAIPPLKDLIRDFGDVQNRRIYLQRYEIERLLVDRLLAASPIDFERHLTDL